MNEDQNKKSHLNTDRFKPLEILQSYSNSVFLIYIGRGKFKDKDSEVIYDESEIDFSYFRRLG